MAMMEKDSKKKKSVGSGLLRIFSLNETIDCFDEVDDAANLTGREYRIKVVGANTVEFFTYENGKAVKKEKLVNIKPVVAGITKEKVKENRYLVQQFLCDLVGKKLNKDYSKGSLMMLPVSQGSVAQGFVSDAALNNSEKKYPFKDEHQIKKEATLEQQEQPLESFALVPAFLEEFIEHVRHQRDKVACYCETVFNDSKIRFQKEGFGYSSNAMHKDIVRDYVKNNLIDSIFGYKKISHLIAVAVLNQIGND
ncbi:hypothetical protein HMPREF1430_00989, partial [Helicobacter pylori GAM96Ai]|uniref:hypothetical protein n=1 Tax=Helicobacter pylori TaxID=210 RepID=UPI0002BB7AA9